MSDNTENKTNTRFELAHAQQRGAWAFRRHALRLSEHRRVSLTCIKRDLGGHKHTFILSPCVSASGFTDRFLLLSQPLASPQSTTHTKTCIQAKTSERHRTFFLVSHSQLFSSQSFMFSMQVLHKSNVYDFLKVLLLTWSDLVCQRMRTMELK